MNRSVLSKTPFLFRDSSLKDNLFDFSGDNEAPAARPQGIFLKTILKFWFVIPAASGPVGPTARREAGIQANKKTGFRIKCGMTETR